jgi:formylmethanofuran dehydrogenase subunit B
MTTHITRLTASSRNAIHGYLGSTSWLAPRLVAQSDQIIRSDQNNTIKANEYVDEPDVLEAKMKKIAELMQKSKFTTVYSGAGLSRASGIPDYATKAKDSIVNTPKISNSLEALPTYAHHVLTAIQQKGKIHHWLNQNHDGLPQKGGYPQEKINDIHGNCYIIHNNNI